MQTLVTSNHTPSPAFSHSRDKRIVLCDDDPLVRSAVRLILTRHGGYRIIGEASDGDEAIRLTAQTRPDVLLLDLNMPKRPGLASLHDLRMTLPEMRTILLTVSIERRQILEALQAGARGIVLKEAARNVLHSAIENVMRGFLWVDDKPVNDVSELLQKLRNESQAATGRAHLTPRERQVVELIVEGCTNKDIAKTLATTEQVIKNYMGKIFDKLGVFNRLELALYAIDNGLVRRKN